MAFSSRSYEKPHKPQQLHCPNNITTKRCHRNIAELYDDPSKGNERTLKLRDRPVQGLLPQAIGSPPVRKSDVGTSDRNFIHSLDKAITTCSEFARTSSRSPPGLAIDSPQLEPIVSQPCPPKALRPVTSSGNSTKAIPPLYPNSRPAQEAHCKANYDYHRQSTIGSQETRSNHTARGRRPIGASLEPGTKTSLHGSQQGEILGLWPKITPCERPIPTVLVTSKSVTYLPVRGSESHPLYTKKSAPSIRRSDLYEILRLPKLPQPPWGNTPMPSAFGSDDEEKYSCFNFLRIYQRKSSERCRFGKNNSLSFKRCRSKNAFSLSSPSIWI
ncbi:hypothetical protein BGZ63DRAFT_397005 [Mariannaea sp. PMI_226]|nr:hypothetical protein BGZ63DRAFT_397005 [Mariannaea sp. PMI_226]